MSTTQTLVLGAIAGFTIFLGLPLGRVGGGSPAMRAALTAFATGILLFLLWDVLAHGVEPVEAAVEGHDWSRVAQLAPLLGGGLALGLMSLVYYDRWMTGKRATPLVGPGAVAAGSILYVVIQLLDVCRRYALPTVVAWWILIGLMLGFATDFVLVAAGA